MSCTDTLAVRPIMLRGLGGMWEDVATQVRVEASTVGQVALSGIDDLGRINRFLGPTLARFLMAAHCAAEECAEALDDAGAAVRITGEEIRSTDEEVAAQLRAATTVVQGVRV